MINTAFNSAEQVNSSARLNKKRLDVTSLPVIDPHLISIKCLASRLIGEVEDLFNQITNASSNDGKEVTIPRREGGYWFKPTWYKEARLSLDAAFDALIRHTLYDIVGSISTWHSNAVGGYLSITSILEYRFGIEPPSEIKPGVEAIRQVTIKRDLLTHMTLNIH